eukprot:COSAG02_NODE_36559_length_453_cov_0.751412_1_plen_117_part_10
MGVHRKKSVTSKEIHRISPGQNISVDEAEPNFDGTMITRLHIEPASLNVIDSDGEEVEADDIEGWITLKDDTDQFVKKLDAIAAEEAEQEEDEEEEEEQEEQEQEQEEPVADKLEAE